jgi:hypothetical protein
MSYGATHLYLSGANAPGFNRFDYTTDDTMATVLDINGDGYFDNGPDAAPKLAVGDRIRCYCSDGTMDLKVSAVAASTGIVTVQFQGGNLPIRTAATGTAAGDGVMQVGYMELSTESCSGTRYVLPVPYAGAEVFVIRSGSGTGIVSFDAGGSASNLSWVDGTVGGGTGVTYDATGNRRINLQAEGEWFHAVGSSTSRWRLKGYGHQASAVNEGASVFLVGT